METNCNSCYRRRYDTAAKFINCVSCARGIELFNNRSWKKELCNVSNGGHCETVRILCEYFSLILSTEFSEEENWKDFLLLAAFTCGLARWKWMRSTLIVRQSFILFCILALEACVLDSKREIRTKVTKYEYISIVGFLSSQFWVFWVAYTRIHLLHHINAFQFVWIIGFPCSAWERWIWISAGSHFTAII